jgi:transcriptional regulator with XRE-family HTH domain
LSQEVVARWAGISQTQLSRIESGTRVQDLGRLSHWARVLRIPQRLLWFEVAGVPGGGEDLPAVAGGPAAECDEVSATIRREFVALGGVAAAVPAVAKIDSELDLIHLTLDRGTASEQRVAHLEHAVGDLGVRVRQVPPPAVLATAVGTLRSVRMLLEQRQPTGYQARLVRVSAMLAQVVGDILFTTGALARADDWYMTAGHAAADAGDRYLADIALYGRGFVAMYCGDARGTLALLTPRLEATPTPTPAVASLWGLKARAHVTLAEADDFARSIDHSRDCLARSAPALVRPGIFSFRPSKLAFFESTGLVQLGKAARGIEAADRALSLYEQTENTDRALAGIDRASALATSGEVPEACRAAIAALRGHGTFQGTAVRRYAARFDRLVRVHSLPEVREWRDVRAEVHGRGGKIQSAGGVRA